ncbi:uncharacterized protein F5891DRAFT_1258325 [Suillus fuscotomentosus]|uniref:Uncharacterized protein n=1 Tax=Suillus fuscotomentosus TaxID=1912939 RepID=A0AAD4DTL3_9AGAM|nr:uncharacterized protein F5891DRAFT_1258325 [Suillus fuscotomentosus]KAG1893720.1 hypothetical protein F5891DRAFT_1258325 [Suillus fuscotomentosus]
MLTSGLVTLICEDGQTGIWKGFGTTFVGCSSQGMFKYGLYEWLVRSFLANTSPPSGSLVPAEVFADIALCPLEMTKVKIQTSPSGTFSTAFGATLAETSKTKIPYTMAKFFFEKMVQLKKSYANTTQLGITFASGYLAGAGCAIIFHPPDSIISLMGKPANKGESIVTIASETCFAALATKGLGTQVLMISTLTVDKHINQSFQWWIYNSSRASMGLVTTGDK